MRVAKWGAGRHFPESGVRQLPCFFTKGSPTGSLAGRERELRSGRAPILPVGCSFLTTNQRPRTAESRSKAETTGMRVFGSSGSREGLRAEVAVDGLRWGWGVCVATATVGDHTRSFQADRAIREPSTDESPGRLQKPPEDSSRMCRASRRPPQTIWPARSFELVSLPPQSRALLRLAENESSELTRLRSRTDG
jgi:hypothetical protein